MPIERFALTARWIPTASSAWIRTHMVIYTFWTKEANQAIPWYGEKPNGHNEVTWRTVDSTHEETWRVCPNW